MAGNDNRHRIGAVGRTNRAKSFWRVDGPGKLRISADLAIANFQQSVPASQLEFRPVKIERKREFTPLSGKILPQLIKIRP